MSDRHGRRCAAAGVVVVLASLALPAGVPQGVAALAVALLALAVMGRTAARRGLAGGWWLLTGAAGVTVLTAVPRLAGLGSVDLRLVTLVHLLAYPALGVGWLLAADASPRPRLERAMATAGGVAAAAVVLTLPGAPAGPLPAPLAAAVFPVLDAVVLAAFLRLRRPPLSAALATTLLADAGAALAPASRVQGPLLAVTCVLLATAALGSTAGTLFAVGAAGRARVRRTMIGTLTGALVVAPCVLAVEQAVGRRADGLTLTIALGVLAAGVLAAVERLARAETACDPATALARREVLIRHLEGAVARAGPDRTGVIVLVDIDRFAVLNDAFGTAAGDEALRGVATALERVAPDALVVARVGGDQFGVVWEGVAPRDASDRAHALRLAVAGIALERAPGHQLSASVGVTAFDAATPAEEVLRRADGARYAAKARGRDRVEAYQARDDELARLAVDTHSMGVVRSALQDDRLRLLFQPICDTRTGAISHSEALVRLEQPDGTLLGPDAFIGVCERHGLIGAIDRWVVRAAVERIRTERQRGRPVRLAVNLSGTALGDGELLAEIGSVVRESGINPRHLMFEVTETAAVENLTDAVHFISTLRELGCQFALDDFGSGTANFVHLRRLPVGIVKIDGSFIGNLVSDVVDQALVGSINQVAHVMGMLTIAERVEDESTLRLLRRLGVDFVQGYAVGRPSPTLLEALPSWPTDGDGRSTAAAPEFAVPPTGRL